MKRGDRSGERKFNRSDNPEGRERWQHRMQESGAVDSPKKMSKVWILIDGKNLKLVTLMTGLNDTRYVEVKSGELKEGDEVIIGSSSSDNNTAMSGQNNPFQQRAPGGGGRGGARF